MIRQIIFKDRIYWQGTVREMTAYLNDLCRRYRTVQELIEKKLN